jgi:hypothetical protein
VATRSPKARGTSRESALVATLQAHGIPARRLAEGGNRDEGDIEAIYHPTCDACFYEHPGRRLVIESKEAEALSPHAAYAAARAKTEAPLLLAWTRYKSLTEGRKRRTPVGTLVMMDLPTLFRLLGRG